MYLSKFHRLPDPEAAFALIAARPLGAWVCQINGALVANHIPFLLAPGNGPEGSLIGHVSRANPVWRGLGSGTDSVVMFQGPQAYITPGWYPTKAEHGKVVPTWNYQVTHVHGVARAIDDPAWLLSMLTRLTTAQEADRPVPWAVSDAPTDYLEKMLRGIVGIEIGIQRVEGKLKASQDEAQPDRLGTVTGLRARSGEDARAMAELVHRALPPE